MCCFVLIYRFHQVHAYLSHKTCIATPCTLLDGSIAWTIFVERDAGKPQMNLGLYNPKSDEFFIKVVVHSKKSKHHVAANNEIHDDARDGEIIELRCQVQKLRDSINVVGQNY